MIPTHYETELIPVVIISSSSEAESRAKGFEMGATDFVPKPFLAEELRARVKAAIKGSARVAV
jgi:DNA-binding response OmpR family regulator